MDVKRTPCELFTKIEEILTTTIGVSELVLKHSEPNNRTLKDLLTCINRSIEEARTEVGHLKALTLPLIDNQQITFDEYEASNHINRELKEITRPTMIQGRKTQLEEEETQKVLQNEERQKALQEEERQKMLQAEEEQKRLVKEEEESRRKILQEEQERQKKQLQEEEERQKKLLQEEEERKKKLLQEEQERQKKQLQEEEERQNRQRKGEEEKQKNLLKEEEERKARWLLEQEEEETQKKFVQQQERQLREEEEREEHLEQEEVQNTHLQNEGKTKEILEDAEKQKMLLQEEDERLASERVKSYTQELLLQHERQEEEMARMAESLVLCPAEQVAETPEIEDCAGIMAIDSDAQVSFDSVINTTPVKNENSANCKGVVFYETPFKSISATIKLLKGGDMARKMFGNGMVKLRNVDGVVNIEVWDTERMLFGAELNKCFSWNHDTLEGPSWHIHKSDTEPDFDFVADFQFKERTNMFKNMVKAIMDSPHSSSLYIKSLCHFKSRILNEEFEVLNVQFLLFDGNSCAPPTVVIVNHEKEYFRTNLDQPVTPCQKSQTIMFSIQKPDGIRMMVACRFKERTHADFAYKLLCINEESFT
ncbi:unnamed protein product [Bursaphelenchus okinawaensis]|uniref:Uncharacterized protein n=1 Tax=Bursaphelenchus okinawaensis TaxID=465554 RepID=A0A811K8M8_9BILA|nr:unnamed protein product [Bursaphelenchus okinawaensis]CAG9093308.1 unnamed protein product [Bursaphelenchus okinawaensis]